MDEIREQYIKDRAKEVWDKIEGAKIFGKPINTHDIDELIIAAYTIGSIDAFDSSLKTIDKAMKNG